MYLLYMQLGQIKLTQGWCSVHHLNSINLINESHKWSNSPHPHEVDGLILYFKIKLLHQLQQ